MKHKHSHKMARPQQFEWGSKYSKIDRLRKYVEPIVLVAEKTGKASASTLIRIRLFELLSIYMSNSILVAFRSSEGLVLRRNRWGKNLESHYQFLNPLEKEKIYDDDEFAEKYELALKKHFVNFASELVTKRLGGKK